MCDTAAGVLRTQHPPQRVSGATAGACVQCSGKQNQRNMRQHPCWARAPSVLGLAKVAS